MIIPPESTTIIATLAGPQILSFDDAHSDQSPRIILPPACRSHTHSTALLENYESVVFPF
jgi:hypothetical protein